MRLRSREKILLFFVIIAAAIWAFDHFYYTPQQKKIIRLREEMKAADLKLKEASFFAKGIESLEAEVSRLEKAFQRFEKHTFHGEGFRTFLKHLGRNSDRLQMKIISLTSREEKITVSEERTRLPFEYRRIKVEMVLYSTYPALRQYLGAIERGPFLATVDHLRTERDEERLPFLKVTMGVAVHLLGPPPSPLPKEGEK